MGNFFSGLGLSLLSAACLLLADCGGASPTRVVANQVPTSVSLLPGPNVSLEVGKTQLFTASARDTQNRSLVETFAFQSSNPSVLTIANNGTACAGTWDSVISPLICAPGGVGTAQVTAVAQGVTSSPVTVYVHQTITGISISQIPGPTPTLSSQCLSKGAPSGPESWMYEASAFNGATDITASVGPFTWQVVNPSSTTQVVSLSAVGSAAILNQQVVTANTPGLAQVFASASGFNSQPVSVLTCPVQSISFSSLSGSGTSFLVNTGTSTTMNATVKDILGMPLTNVPLTWTPSNPASVGANPTTPSNSPYGSVGTVTGSAPGGSTVIASCTPPACNGGIKPSLAVYPQSALSFQVKSTSAPASPTVYVTTMACADPLANPTNASCNPTIVPVTRSGSSSTFTAGSPLALPFTPNSFVYDDNGTNAYLGVNSSRFGQQGLVIFNGSSFSTFTGVAGKVLAISPDRSTAILSDTADSPNQVFICTNCAASSRTATPLVITGATAAAFSPDSLKAYIVAGNNLYVYSKLDPLETIPLGSGLSGQDVTFFPQGGFAYIAEAPTSSGPSAQYDVYRTCDNSLDAGATLVASGNPLMIRPLPDAATLMALAPPNIDLISVSAVTVTPSPTPACPQTSISNSLTSFNLGQGSFIPTQLVVSPDGSAAYILGETQTGPPPLRLPYVVAFNIQARTSSVISLANGATPLSATLSLPGDLLFVGADDASLHVIDTASGTDLEQVSFVYPTSELCFGPGNPATNLESVVNITAASSANGTVTYSYTLTSGPPLQVSSPVKITGMTSGGNNGLFTITALGTGTFTVANPNGVTASGQSGTGLAGILCNPDLVAVKP